MTGAKTVLVNLTLLFSYASTVLILDCGPANVPAIEGRTIKLQCTGINDAANVEWRHVISGGTANDIIVSTCQDQNVCTDNSPSRYRATRPTSNTSVLTIVSISRDDTTRWTCLAGVDQATCSVPAAIYPADVMERCQVAMTEDSVEVTCTILKAYPSPNCTWFECFVPESRLGNLSDTTDCQISPDQTHLKPPTTFIENGNFYFNTSCWVLTNITKLVGTLNYTVVISPGPVVRSSVVPVTSGSVSPTLTVVSTSTSSVTLTSGSNSSTSTSGVTLTSGSSSSTSTSGVTLTSGSSSSAVHITPSSTTVSESTWPSTRQSENSTNNLTSTLTQLSPVGSALVPYGIIGIAVGSVLLVAIVTAVIYTVLKRRQKKTQQDENPMTKVEQPANHSGDDENETEYMEIPEEEPLPSPPRQASSATPVPTDESDQYMKLVNVHIYQSLTSVNLSNNNETELSNCIPPAPHCASTSNDDYLVPVPI